MVGWRECTWHRFDGASPDRLCALPIRTPADSGGLAKLGLLLSTMAPSQLGAIQLFFSIFLPSILLSGFMFPYQGMPVVAQHLAEVLPMTHFKRIVRGIILRDVEFDGLSHDLLFLSGFFVVTPGAAVVRFKRRLD